MRKLFGPKILRWRRLQDRVQPRLLKKHGVLLNDDVSNVVDMCVYVRAGMWVGTCARVYVCLGVCVCACSCASVSVSVCACTHVGCMYVFVYVSVSVCMLYCSSAQ